MRRLGDVSECAVQRQREPAEERPRAEAEREQRGNRDVRPGCSQREIPFIAAVSEGDAHDCSQITGSTSNMPYRNASFQNANFQ